MKEILFRFSALVGLGGGFVKEFWRLSLLALERRTSCGFLENYCLSSAMSFWISALVSGFSVL